MRPLDGIAVDRLVARARYAPAATVRKEASRRLGSADVPLPGTPSSILIVRSLRDPLPGAIRTSRGTHVADPGWMRAFGDRLREVHASAGRPAVRAVPPDVGAVLFADEAELLACLLEDVVGGRHRDRWWWSTLLDRMPRPPDVESVLADNTRNVPAVFRVLAERGSAVSVCRLLTAEASLRILRAVLAEHAAEHLLTVLESWAIEPTATTGPPDRDRPRTVRADGGPLGTLQDNAASIGARIDELPAANAVLLGVALMLHRSPDSLMKLVAPAAPSRRKYRTPGSASEARTPLRSRRHHEIALAGATGGRTVDGDDPDRTVRESPPTKTVVSPYDLESRPKLPDRPGSTTDPIGARAVSRPSPSAPEIEIRPAPPASGTVDLDGAVTRWGGALYLINVMDRLGLPEVFEPDWPLASGLGRWALLEVLMRGLLAAAGRSTGDDPMFDALRALDGRDDPLPGTGFPECFDWRLPASWRAAIADPADALRYAVEERTLTVWSPVGCTIASVSTGTNAGRALQRERGVLRRAMPGAELVRDTADNAPRADVEALRDAGLDRSIVRWLELTLPALRIQIGSALGRSGADPGAVVDELIALPGRLHVTATRVDLVVPLDAVRLPVRVAGFDLDPGWRPELGRIVRFHFESGGGYR